MTAPFAITMDHIMEAVCEMFGTTRAELISQRRLYGTVYARHVAWYVARQITTYSYPDIAKAVQRDHTSVISGVRHIEDVIKTDETLLRLVAAVMVRVQEQHLERIKQWQTTNSVKSLTSSARRLA